MFSEIVFERYKEINFHVWNAYRKKHWFTKNHLSHPLRFHLHVFVRNWVKRRTREISQLILTSSNFPYVIFLMRSIASSKTLGKHKSKVDV